MKLWEWLGEKNRRQRERRNGGGCLISGYWSIARERVSLQSWTHLLVYSFCVQLWGNCLFTWVTEVFSLQWSFISHLTSLRRRGCSNLVLASHPTLFPHKEKVALRTVWVEEHYWYLVVPQFKHSLKEFCKSSSAGLEGLTLQSERFCSLSSRRKNGWAVAESVRGYRDKKHIHIQTNLTTDSLYTEWRNVNKRYKHFKHFSIRHRKIHLWTNSYSLCSMSFVSMLLTLNFEYSSE